MEVHEIRVVISNILTFLLIFVTLQLPPPDENHYPLQHRLFGNFHGDGITTSAFVLEKHW